MEVVTRRWLIGLGAMVVALAHIDGGRHTCVNSAYGDRGQRDRSIPAICKLEPPLSRFAVRDAAQPRQGVRGYAYVIWGTGDAATDVVASFTCGTARAAVFKVSTDLAVRRVRLQLVRHGAAALRRRGGALSAMLGHGGCFLR